MPEKDLLKGTSKQEPDRFLEALARRREELGLPKDPPPAYPEPTDAEIEAVKRRARKASGMPSLKDRLLDAVGK